MNAGDLRHRIDIDDKVTTQDGEGGEIVSWVAWADDVPAAIGALSAREMLAAGALASIVSSKIVIRWRPGVVPTMRVRHPATGTVYNIAGALPDPDSGREFITLLVNSGANDGQ